MRLTITAFAILSAVGLVYCLGAVADPPVGDVHTQFRDKVQPFLKTYCSECHGGAKPKGDFDLADYTSFDAVVKNLKQWEGVLEQLDGARMPPVKAKQHPPAELRKEIAAWIRTVRTQEGKRTAGDPGPVPARRLSNAEYDYTIRDLTGANIRPAQEFPVDPSNEAGFDNSAESLSMSPALLNKYLEAARKVSEHLVFETDGLTFAGYPVTSDTDRDKFCVRQVIDFYKRQRTDYADYFQAAWKFRHRAALGKPQATLAEIAASDGVSPKYLATIWATLDGPAQDIGPIAALRVLWNDLPAPEERRAEPRKGPDGEQNPAPLGTRLACEKMRDFVVKVRDKLVPEVKNLTAPGMNQGSQPLVLWKNRAWVANRIRYVPGPKPPQLEKLAPGGTGVPARPDGLPSPSHDIVRLLTTPSDPAAVKKFDASLSSFCAVFPDAFFISERTRTAEDKKDEKSRAGRLLNAGFHSMTGYFRDDGPLYELVLSKDEQRELDRLWLDFDVITGAPIRQYTSFIWYEHAESGFMRGAEFETIRAEDKDCISEAKIKQLKTIFLANARKKGASETAQTAIKEHFEIIAASIRRVEKARLEAEPRHLEALQTFAERAYRRPLSKPERDGIVSFYRTLRDKDGLDHQDAVRDVLVSVLLSPNFLFRTQPEGRGQKTEDRGQKTVPLSDYALASRLSYFLWATMPDVELLKRAEAGDLHKNDVLAAQVRRMVKDERVRGLATEFAGNWLDFRRFEEHNAVDRERFKSFNDDLRRAMFEEPIRFFIDVARSDRSVIDFLDGRHTFVNPLLARHYGMPEIGGRKSEVGSRKSEVGSRIAFLRPPTSDLRPPTSDLWVRVDDASNYQRGGLLPMAVFQTKNAPGLRTSPVKRGYWVVRRLLGEKIPAPPAEVPVLPADEAKLDLPLRDVLARHRADKACAGCHARFDAIGLAFEGYGPIGELRKVDLAGRPIDATATFPANPAGDDGGKGSGLDGLRTYLRERRQDEFLNHLCRQLLSYALSRTLLPSDDDLVQTMRQRLAANENRFSVLLEAIVTSPQFLNRRGG